MQLGSIPVDETSEHTLSYTTVSVNKYLPTPACELKLGLE